VQLPDNWGDLSHDPSTNAPPVDEVLKDQITEAITSAEKFETVKTQGEADKAAEILDRLRKLWKDGDTARATEKKPHDDAASKVQAKWLPVIDPARIAATELKGKVAAFLKAEEDRVRIAHAQAAEGDAEAAMPLPKVQARTAYSRATSLRTVRRGWITDHKKFVAALIKNKDQDFIDFLTNKANALARAKTTLPGMEIKETKE
jgi:hypothetical protein